MEILEQRLRSRGDTAEDAIQKRLAQAKNEIDYCKQEGKNDKVIINDDLDQAFKELDEWVMQGISA
jgi:guanylate kinase